DPRVRMYAASTLGNLGARDLLPYLVTLADDPQINVRYNAVEAMGRFYQRQAIGALKEVLSHERAWYVSSYALHALRVSLARREK
ncbi:MAG: HEAT repeat domain-containing protein, partial [Nitrospinota bacterium]